jgi:hypothetical protein
MNTYIFTATVLHNGTWVEDSETVTHRNSVLAAEVAGEIFTSLYGEHWRITSEKEND